MNKLEALARRVARLNPDCAEIGAGMLASLVQDAKEALNESYGPIGVHVVGGIAKVEHRQFEVICGTAKAKAAK